MNQTSQPEHAKIFTITFHGIGHPGRQLEPGEQNVWIAYDRFLSILDQVPRDGSVRITFDDGNASDLILALPALIERGLYATFFVVAGRVGQDGFLSEADLGELLRSGMDVGSHGMWHRPWKRMGLAVAREEILVAKQKLEDILGRPITKAACPFGAYDRNSLKQIKRAGFSAVYTSDRGSARPRDWLQARNTVRATDGPDIVSQLLSERASRSHAWVRRARLLMKRSYPLWDTVGQIVRVAAEQAQQGFGEAPGKTPRVSDGLP